MHLPGGKLLVNVVWSERSMVLKELGETGWGVRTTRDQWMRWVRFWQVFHFGAAETVGGSVWQRKFTPLSRSCKVALVCHTLCTNWGIASALHLLKSNLKPTRPTTKNFKAPYGNMRLLKQCFHLHVNMSFRFQEKIWNLRLIAWRYTIWAIPVQSTVQV